MTRIPVYLALLEEEMAADDVLRCVYFDVSSPACFAGAEALFNEAKKRTPDLTRSQVREFLAKVEAYSLHKPARRRFVRNPIIVNGIDVMWEIDLADLSMLKKHNDKYTFLLQIIDALSRHAWSVPIKSKTPEVVAKAFEQVLKDSGRKPITVSSDAGREFTGKAFQDMLKKRGIHHFVASSDMKCPIVERWNRTLKTRMWRYFTHNNTFRYIDVLQDLVHAYNHSKHRVIGCAPAEVTIENATVVAERQYRCVRKPLEQYKYNVGDHVRISKKKGTFEKGYESNWTREIFVIYQRAARPLPVYKIRDLNGEKVVGVFYEAQLQKVIPPDTHKVEKILRWRKARGGRRQALVRWLGYGAEFDQWVDEEDLTQL